MQRGELQAENEQLKKELRELRMACEDERESSALAKELLREASDGILLLHGNSIVYANAKVAWMSGIPEEELKHKSVVDILAMIAEEDFERIAGLLQEAAERPITASYSYYMQGDRENRLRIKARSYPLTYNGKSMIAVYLSDVSEQDRVSRDLRQSRAFYNALTHHFPNGLVSLLDRDLTILYSAGSIARSGDIDLQAMKGRKASECFQPGEFEQYREHYERALKGESVEYERFYLGKSMRMYLLPNIIDGAVNSLTVISIDISSQKQLERQLLSQRDIFRSVIEHIPFDIFWKDRDLVYRGANQNFINSFGEGKRENIVGKKVSDLDIPARFQARFDEEDLGIIRTGKEVLNKELEIPRGNGSLSIIEYSKAPMLDAEGNVTGVLSISRDITELRELEYSLKELNRIYQTLLKNYPDGSITLYDDELYVVMTEGKLYEQVNIDPQALGGVKIAEYMGEERMRRLEGPLYEGIAGRQSRTEFSWDDKTYESHIIPMPQKVRGKKVAMTITRDITERKQAEDDLLKSEEKFFKAFHSSPSIMAISTVKDGIYIDVNESFLSYLGYSREEVIGNKSKDINLYADPDDRDRLISELKQKGRLVNYELRYRKKSGSIGVGLFSTEVIEIDGQLLLLNIMNDITERKELEDKLARHQEELQQTVDLRTRELRDANERLKREIAVRSQAEDAFRNLVEYSLQGLIILKDERVVFANTAIEQMLGLTAAQLKKMEPAELRRRLKFPDVFNLQYTGNEEKSQQRFEVTYVRPDGAVRMLEMYSSEILYYDSPAVQATAIDITERIASEIALRESEQRHRLLFQTMAQGIVYQLADGTPLSANPAAGEILGMTNAQMLQKAPPPKGWYVINEEGEPITEAEYPPSATLKTGKEVTDAVLGVVHPSRSYVTWVLVSSTPVIDEETGSMNQVYTSFIDITRQKETENANRKALERAHQLNEMKSRFVAMVSHEFRTPLSVIFSSIEILRDFSEKLDTRQKSLQFKKIENSISAFIALLDDVITINRADLGKFRLTEENFELLEFIDGIIREEQEHQPDQKSVAIESSYTSLFIRSDKKFMQHIISNLLSNALKYSPDGEEVVIRLQMEQDRLSIFVADKGIGIPEEDREQLFEPFSRGSNISNISGTGLGLAIVQRFVKMMKGEITFSSIVNQGSEFKVALPVKIIDKVEQKV